MKILLDTNIVIHREASTVINEDIGVLFRWLDNLHHTKCIHSLTVEEIEKHQDPKVRKSFEVKLGNYNILKTKAPMSEAVRTAMEPLDKNQNDLNDTVIINELYCGRVDALITEDKQILNKASLLGISDRAYTIDSFLEQVTAENPGLIDYKVLSVRRSLFGDLDLSDDFFASFKEDYPGYEKWFNKKAEETVYVCLSEGKPIGVMLSHADQSTHINIFIPGRIDKSNVQDLGLVFKDKAELVSAVFNEDYGVLARANEKTIEVQKADKTPLFDIYMLDLENDVSIESQFGGSTIRIQIPEHLKNKKHYYRIRLKCAFVDQAGYVYTPPPSSILEGAFFQTELIDFRLNEKRNLPSSLLEAVRQNGEVRFTKTHFFLMREASDDYVFSHKPPGGRQLEKDTWKAYAGEEYSFERITAYHWKEALPHDSFSVFVKFRSFHSDRRTILIAIVVIIILGVIGSFLGNLLYSLVR